MAEIGSCWESGSWASDTWAADTWADASGVLTDDGIRVFIESVEVEAYLSGAWVSLSSDVFDGSLTIKQGISGGKDTDLVATPAEINFDLINSAGKYYVQGASPLSGWALDVKVRCSVTYDGTASTQFVGWVRRTQPIVAISAAADGVRVTCFGWLEQASRALIELPSIQRNKTAREATLAVLGISPILPESYELADGTTFLTVFDTVREKTTGFAELAKIARSEFAHLYERRDGTLVLEDGDQRDSSVPVASVPLIKSEMDLLVDENGDFIVDENGDYIGTGGTILLGTLDGGYSAFGVEEGAYYLNQLKVRVEPRRVDETPVVLASTPSPVLVEAGGSKTITLDYVDPTGRARRVAAITDEMVTPSPGGTVDTNIKLLLHFDQDFTDSTGNHTVTENDVTIEKGQYKDGYYTPIIPNGIIGNFAIFGGYADYNLSIPDSADFDLPTGDGYSFTIGCWVCLVDVSSGTGDTKAIMARHSGAYPPWLFGYFDEPSVSWLLYASTDGASWDYADGVVMGKAAASRWQYLEWSHKNGWNYLSVNGKMATPFYSADALPAGGAAFSVGLTQSSKYIYAAQDELFILHNQCLHTADFDPPSAEMSIYLDEDYWGNLAQEKTGTDITSDITITPSYGTEKVEAVLANANGADGYVYYQQRGIGVYFDAAQEASVEYSAGIAADGYRSATVEQKYQHDVADGLAKITTILANRQEKRTDLVSVGFHANRSSYFMRAALYCDVGDLIQVQSERVGIDGYYYIQARELKFGKGGTLYCTWRVTQDFEHGA